MRTGNFITEAALMARLEKADLILLGEVHDDPIHHHVQTEIITKLIDGGRRPALYFEMLTDQEEAAHEVFLRGWTDSPNNSSDAKDKARKDVLAWENRGWPVWDAYAPIFRLADQYGLPVRHGDLPAELMRNVRRFGLLAIPKQLRTRLFENLKEAELTTLSDRLQHAVSTSHPQEAKAPGLAGLIQAQMTRDAHIAHRISQSKVPAILIAGVEHVRKDRGVPFHLRSSATQLNVISITLSRTIPYDQETKNNDELPFDFLWLADLDSATHSKE